MRPSSAQDAPKWGPVGLKLASGGDLGAKMAEDGEDDFEDAASELQDAVQEASGRDLGRSWEGFEGV